MSASEGDSRIGIHASISGELAHALREAAELGCQTVQLFSRNPRAWTVRALDADEVAAFRRERERLGLDPVIIHAPYLLNLAAANPEIRERSIGALRQEIQRAVQLGAEYLVLHPGSAPGCSPEEGIRACARALRRAVRGMTLDSLTILLENTAGQGHQIGWRFEHLAALLDELEGIPVGICLDTAHAFAAGYDLATEAGFAETLARLRATVGLEHVRLLHLNDTRVARGGRVDRHWHVGEGNLGAEAFRRLLANVAFRGRPLILETPRKTLEDDRRNLARVRAWVASNG
ncbi:MAG: deoxyribonuclease IV [Blastocatellia bacterium]|nr:deoxyribonuclease IV [Blastocatellia bacterium]MCS7156496.1 deoxyribonuclease IV [Blastocatellia bacterium]MCX7751763.1 deoxyribonuclease IV [Blastocatellia bacterium]MDW8168865.1 deoxyribonuclease IV [Acidobacteriota bacterium]MDW8256625.1 deoxyribonuclease IV [Acidobacteriota bacterium]